MAATLQFIGLLGVSSPSLAPSNCCSGRSSSKKQSCSVHLPRQQRRSLYARAVETDATSGEPAAATVAPEEPPSIDFAFVSPRLLPDGTPDVHYRTACGGQKLRDIMLQGFIDLYGPYDKLLLNCSGGGVCGTCIVEVVEGKELLSPKTEIEREKLKRSLQHVNPTVGDLADLEGEKTEQSATPTQNQCDMPCKNFNEIFNTAASLERSAISHIAPPMRDVFAIGPLHAMSSAPAASLWRENNGCTAWLDGQADRSVVYVSLGSLAVISLSSWNDSYTRRETGHTTSMTVTP